MNEIIRAVRETVTEHGLLIAGDTVVVGVSGGADSLVLLHVLACLGEEFGVRLAVGHLEHGIRGPESLADAEYVREIGKAWGVPVTVAHRDVPALARARGLALEEAARQERYRFLAVLARSLGGRTVAVAHHGDDQVETVLMHLLRGAGLGGLRGMRPLSWLDELRLGEEPEAPPAAGDRIRLIRPLLGVERAAIEEYCRAEGLRPRFDRSNLDTTYFRNRLRHELIPILETYNPNVRAVLRRTAEAVAGDYALLREHLAVAWPGLVRAESSEAIIFDLEALRGLPDGLLRSALREGIHRLRWSLRNIGWVHVDDAVRVVRRGQTGAAATLPGGLLLRLGYDDAALAAADRPPAPSGGPRLEGAPREVAVPGCTPLGAEWELVIREVARGDLPHDWDVAPHPLVAYLDADRLAQPLALRSRRPGDWLMPLGMGGRRQRLADLMINVKIPRAERDGTPLLVGGEEIAWVVGWRTDTRSAVREGTRRILVAEVRRRRAAE